jgi:hypothetical protein
VIYIISTGRSDMYKFIRQIKIFTRLAENWIIIIGILNIIAKSLLSVIYKH